MSIQMVVDGCTSSLHSINAGIPQVFGFNSTIVFGTNTCDVENNFNFIELK